eukprot:Em0270g3a
MKINHLWAKLTVDLVEENAAGVVGMELDCGLVNKTTKEHVPAECSQAPTVEGGAHISDWDLRLGTRWCKGYVVLFEQASNTFYVTVDTVHAAAITAVIVPLLTMKVSLRDFPARRANMALQPLTACVLSPPEWYLAPDEFDAVSVQNVGSTYIIVSWDLPTDSNGILINFSLYCNGALAGVLPLTVISFNTTGLLPFTL